MKDFQIGLCGKNKNNQILQNFFKNVDRYYQTKLLLSKCFVELLSLLSWLFLIPQW